MKVAENSFVEIEYEAYVKSPLSFKEEYNITDTINFQLGTGKIHTEFEKEIIGMEKQEEKEFDLIIKKKDQNLIIWKKKRDLTFDDMPSEGKRIEFDLPNREKIIGTILVVKENEVLIDLNPPLAGKSIHFTVKILKVS
jgi:peptidylprolyl isomerase